MSGRMVFDPSELQQPPPKEIPKNDYNLNISSPIALETSSDQYGTSACFRDEYSNGAYAWADPEFSQPTKTSAEGDVYGRNSGEFYGDVNMNPTYADNASQVYSSEANFGEYSKEQESNSRQPPVPSLFKFQQSSHKSQNGVPNSTSDSHYVQVSNNHTNIAPVATGRVRKLTPYPVAPVPRGNQFLSTCNSNYHEPDVYFKPSPSCTDGETTEVYSNDSKAPSTPMVNAVDNKEYFLTHHRTSPSSPNFVNFGESLNETGNREAPIPAPRRNSSAATVSSARHRKMSTVLNINRPENFFEDASDDENVLGGSVPPMDQQDQHQTPTLNEKFMSQNSSAVPTFNQLPSKFNAQAARTQAQNRVALPLAQASASTTAQTELNPFQGRSPGSGLNGCTSAALLRQGTALEMNDKPWFNKTMDKNEAEEKLYSRKKVGSYVVRNSRYKDGLNFALSFYYHTVSGTGNVKHLSIAFLEDTHQWQVGNDHSRDNPAFNSVVQLVEHYIKNGFCLDDGTSIDLKEALDTRKKSWISGIKFGSKK